MDWINTDYGVVRTVFSADSVAYGVLAYCFMWVPYG